MPIAYRAKIKAKGTRGSWYADVGSERLPCIHTHWLKGTVYDDLISTASLRSPSSLTPTPLLPTRSITSYPTKME
jgi:hypothetical protein